MRIYSTLSGKKEDFVPGDNTVTMYVCGVTVYDDCHIGHAMSYITFDAIKRYLEWRGYTVKHIQNFTDIDDKIITRANAAGLTAKEISEKYISSYFSDMDALNIKRATVYPKATEEIPEIIKIIQKLIEKSNAYESNGSVYFRVTTFPSYGKLSHQNIDEMISKSPVDADAKDSPLDFALWKAAKPGEPSWLSPWGQGRPGWHIECSAMALKYLGDSIDIHGGGRDLIFPHHENEITQSEAYTGVEPFVRFWLHNGLLQLAGSKMSKSLGNLITVKSALEKYTSDGLRLFILSSHYRAPITWGDESIQAAEGGAERLREAALRPVVKGTGSAIDLSQFKDRFIESMEDDFNTAQAIAVLFDMVKEINRGADAGSDVVEAQNLLKELAGILGFMLKGRPEELSDEVAAGIDQLVQDRIEMRKQKRWKEADQIRDDLLKQGIIIEDTPDGTRWKKTSST